MRPQWISAVSSRICRISHISRCGWRIEDAPSEAYTVAFRWKLLAKIPYFLIENYQTSSGTGALRCAGIDCIIINECRASVWWKRKLGLRKWATSTKWFRPHVELNQLNYARQLKANSLCSDSFLCALAIRGNKRNFVCRVNWNNKYAIKSNNFLWHHPFDRGEVRNQIRLTIHLRKMTENAFQ